MPRFTVIAALLVIVTLAVACGSEPSAAEARLAPGPVSPALPSEDAQTASGSPSMSPADSPALASFQSEDAAPAPALSVQQQESSQKSKIETSSQDAAPYAEPAPSYTTAENLPSLAMLGGSGDLVCSLYPDSKGNPGLVAHWTVDVEPGARAMVDYPFVAGDNLELSVFGQKINRAYMESPDGDRIVDISNTLRPWTGDVLAQSDGRYKFYFDNSDGDAVKIMHLVITYHDAAQDSIKLGPDTEDLRISLPLGGIGG